MNVALKIDPTNVNALAQDEMNYGENCINYISPLLTLQSAQWSGNLSLTEDQVSPIAYTQYYSNICWTLDMQSWKPTLQNRVVLSRSKYFLRRETINKNTAVSFDFETLSGVF